MQAKDDVRPCSPMGSSEKQRRNWRKGHHHQNYEGLCVEDRGSVESLSKCRDGLLVLPETLSHQGLRKIAPVLHVQMGIERRRKNIRIGERLRREEKRVGDKEELERSEETAALAADIGGRQGTWRDQNRSRAPKELSVHVAQCAGEP